MMHRRSHKAWLGLLLATCLPLAVHAQRPSTPQTGGGHATAAAAHPALAHSAYPGTIALHVDARDVTQKILRVRETIPVAAPGPLTLLYPKWIPGNHGPSGPIIGVAGLKITAAARTLPWTRDPLDVYAFHVDVPVGVKTVEVQFEFLSPTTPRSGRVLMSPVLLDLPWNTVVLYPAGYVSRAITLAPSVQLPAGWRYASALDLAAREGDTLRFAPTPLDTLLDSPLIAGQHFERIDLAPGAAIPVHLDVVADHARELKVPPALLKAHRELVTQALRLFGSQHYTHYDFLLWISKQIGGQGLEHHQSSENGVGPGYFTDPATWYDRDLLPHEYTHSWNGKFRRPADLWTPNFNVPMQDTLLWVYEGQTQYWGYVLATRSGLWSKAQARDVLAADASSMALRTGRQWRSVEDTTSQPIIDKNRILSPDWANWQRGEDYYIEGALLWLDVDARIRQLTDGRKSLDDFARAFFGVDNGRVAALTYDFADVVKALDAVAPYDWRRFLERRIDAVDATPPLGGLARAGWKLVYTDQPNAYLKAVEARRDYTSYAASIGFVVDKDGRLRDVQWDGPAFQAGLAPGMKLIAVDAQVYSQNALDDAIRAAKGGATPITLTVENQGHVVPLQVNYHGGLRYPHLERIKGTADTLDRILSPLR